MTLRECYEMMGGDYEDAVRRLMSETLLARFVKRSLEDESFRELLDALAEENWENAFRAAHTLKGVALNLSFARLAASASELTESLRDKKGPAPEALVLQVKADYEKTMAAVRAFAGSQ